MTASERLGRIMRNARLAHRLTQAELAERMTDGGIGWHQSTVNKVETGLRPFTFDEAVVVASWFDLDLDAVADLQRPRYEHVAVTRIDGSIA